MSDEAVRATDIRRRALGVITPADLQALADAGLTVVDASRLTTTADAFLQSYTAPLEAENAALRAQLSAAYADVATLRAWRERAVILLEYLRKVVRDLPSGHRSDLAAKVTRILTDLLAEARDAH